MPLILSRRRFVSSTLATGAGLLLAERLLADPYHPLPRTPRLLGAPVRVRGRVTVDGRPRARVAVSDGRQVVATGRDGRYTLVTTSDRPWLSLSLPAGARIPVTATGTSALHRPLAPDARGEMTADFALAASPTDDTVHGFVLLADPQTQNAFEMGRLHAETVPDVRATVGMLGAGQCFGLACGDIMFDDPSLYPEYERAVAAMGVPFFQVTGNHDLDYASRTAEGATVTFERHFGPAHYSFNVGAVHYVVLQDVLWYGDGYVGYLPAEQLEWLAADLALVEKGRPVVVALHIPLASTQPVRTGDSDGRHGTLVNNREALYRLLEGYRANVLSGHTHENEHVFEGGLHEQVVGTTCGAWWSGDICWDGTPNGYAVLEVAGEEVRWRYKATGRPAAHQMRLYPPGSDPTAPGDVIANVWDWTPGWSVTWWEDGTRRGLMSRRTGTDPRAVREQAGADRPARRGWVEPMSTSHLFFAAPSPGTRAVTVEAVDPFGRTYRETLPLG